MAILNRDSSPAGKRSHADLSRAPRTDAFWAGLVIIIVATCAVYYPSIRGGFLLDDDRLVMDSQLVHAPDGLHKFWFTTDAPDYWPMTNSSFWLEWRLWGAEPTGYHVTNLILHVAAVLLIWGILRKHDPARLKFFQQIA